MTFPRRPRVHATMREGRRDWYKIVNSASNGVADVYLFDEVGFWGVSAQEFVDELKAITASRINLHVNSPGGEVFDGLAIYNCLKAHPASVHVMIHGLAASAASFIAQAGDRVTIARNAVMMIHDAAGLAIGDARVMRELADLLDKLSDNCADIYSRRAGGTVAEWRERMLNETWYTGAEAVAAGLADEMTDPDEPAEGEPSEMRNAWDLSVFRYAGRDASPAPAPVDRGPARGEPAPVDRPAVTLTLPDVGEVDVTDHLAGSVVVDQDQPADPDATDPLGLTPDQRATSDLAAVLPDAFVPITDATAPAPDGWAPLVAAMRDPDPWADLTRHLTSADGWAASVAHLTEGAHP